MLVWYGSIARNVEVGNAGCFHCGHCKRPADFTKMIAYRVFHFYGIFRFVPEHKPYLLCGNCGGACRARAGISASQLENAIPVWDRRGWLFGLAGVGAIIAFAVMF